ncbi:uncharacterized protein J3D65DRAFT_172100 [Phyllosticta citribraziliensis]|uniref:Uncharacterized protein n=1 Tax=Phyllosticta citribraziliensis TaxID=989973 RepID=A0ABR1L4F4_9PEZI
MAWQDTTQAQANVLQIPNSMFPRSVSQLVRRTHPCAGGRQVASPIHLLGSGRSSCHLTASMSASMGPGLSGAGRFLRSGNSHCFGCYALVCPDFTLGETFSFTLDLHFFSVQALCFLVFYSVSISFLLHMSPAPEMKKKGGVASSPPNCIHHLRTHACMHACISTQLAATGPTAGDFCCVVGLHRPPSAPHPHQSRGLTRTPASGNCSLSPAGIEAETYSFSAGDDADAAVDPTLLLWRDARSGIIRSNALHRTSRVVRREQFPTFAQ